MREPVRGTGFDGQQAAGNFVFALCSALENGDAVGDAELYYLVVTGFEVQGRVIFQRAPVAAAQPSAVVDVER